VVKSFWQPVSVDHVFVTFESVPLALSPQPVPVDQTDDHDRRSQQKTGSEKEHDDRVARFRSTADGV
jgi:hypothetical protein